MSSPRSRSNCCARRKVKSSTSGSCFPGQALATPEHPSEVGLVLQHQLYDRALPAGRWRRRLFVAELTRDRGGAEAAGGVEVEDALGRLRSIANLAPSVAM